MNISSPDGPIDTALSLLPGSVFGFGSSVSFTGGVEVPVPASGDVDPPAGGDPFLGAVVVTEGGIAGGVTPAWEVPTPGDAVLAGGVTPPGAELLGGVASGIVAGPAGGLLR